MKVIMYHYVRPKNPKFPYFIYLDAAIFRRQVEHFRDKYGLTSKEAFLDWLDGGPVPTGVIFSFDDGLKDHILHASNVLSEFEAVGMMFCCSDPETTGDFLRVHKIHLLLGRVDPDILYRNLISIIGPKFKRATDDAIIETSVYGKYGVSSTTKVKYFFNWSDCLDESNTILDILFKKYCGDQKVSDFYLFRKDLKELHRRGFMVGGHGADHRILSELNGETQKENLKRSIEYISDGIGNQCWYFSYPHGVEGTYNEQTCRVLRESGVKVAFRVESKDVDFVLTDVNRFHIPRFNCNEFKYGQIASQ